jgi:hypothetical protein
LLLLPTSSIPSCPPPSTLLRASPSPRLASFQIRQARAT